MLHQWGSLWTEQGILVCHIHGKEEWSIAEYVPCYPIEALWDLTTSLFTPIEFDHLVGILDGLVESSEAGALLYDVPKPLKVEDSVQF